jgi:AcrR family transcriptional regulator
MDEKIKDIVSKACKLFQKYGIKSVSMDDIARNCGISKKTLYESIKDKTDLVTKVLEIDFLNEGDVFKGVKNSDINAVDILFVVYKSAVELFEEFNMSMEYDLKKYYPSLYEKSKKKRRKHIYERMAMNMEQGRREGFFRDDFNIDLIAKLHILKVEGLLQTDIFDDTNYTVVDIFREMFSHHFMAIATEKGVKAYKEKLKELN